MSLQTEMKTVLAQLTANASAAGMSEAEYYLHEINKLAKEGSSTDIASLISYATTNSLTLALAQLNAHQALAQSRKIMHIDSAASPAGSASVTMTVTGLLTTDEILGVTMLTKGANAVYLQDYNGVCSVAGQLPVVFSGDPGIGAVVRVMIKR